MAMDANCAKNLTFNKRTPLFAIKFPQEEFGETKEYYYLSADDKRAESKEAWEKFYRNNPEFLSMNCFGVELNRLERKIIHYILSKAIERKG